MFSKVLFSRKTTKVTLKISSRLVGQHAKSIMQDVKDKRDKAMLGGGENKIAAQHKKVCLVLFNKIFDTNTICLIMRVMLCLFF